MAASLRTAHKDRSETLAALNEIFHEGSSKYPFGKGPIVVSDVPKEALGGGAAVVMGIDEAGRGSVLGPMTYGAAYWVKKEEVDIPAGYNDSKALTPEQRKALFDETMACRSLGFVLRVLHASEISRNMLRFPDPYNLNAMSHDAAMELVQSVLDAGVAIDTCHVDTVGDPNKYRAKLERAFQGKGIRFVVEQKADATYQTCSAASVGT